MAVDSKQPLAMGDDRAMLESFEETRTLVTAAKRKVERTRGSLAALSSLDRSPAWHAKNILKAEADVTEAHTALATLLEQSDGGDALKRPRAEWWEAAGMAEFVRCHAELHCYLPEVEREVGEAREAWEKVQPAREQLTMQKQAVSRAQGHLHALLELGLTLPAAIDDVVDELQQMWQREESATTSAMERLREALDERRGNIERFHREQGWRKACCRPQHTHNLRARDTHLPGNSITHATRHTSPPV